MPETILDSNKVLEIEEDTRMVFCSEVERTGKKLEIYRPSSRINRH